MVLQDFEHHKMQPHEGELNYCDFSLKVTHILFELAFDQATTELAVQQHGCTFFLEAVHLSLLFFLSCLLSVAVGIAPDSCSR